MYSRRITQLIITAIPLLIATGDLHAQSSKRGNKAKQSNHSKQNYPEFSWDRIPLYMHIRKAKSYTEDEIKFMAKFPLLTFEKSNGHKDHGTIEKGTLLSARAVKKINPDTTILYYRNVIVHYGAYGANAKLEKISEPFLKDKSGNGKLVRSQVEAYDLSNPEFRQWWVDTCSDMTSDPSIDGVFLDGNIKALEPKYLARQIGTEKKEAVTAGYHQMMTDTRKAIGKDKLMLANILRARFPDAGNEYMGYFDGSYLEGFHHSVGKVSYEDYVVKGIEAMQKASSQGKIIAFTSGLAQAQNTSKLGIDEAHTKIDSYEEAEASLTYPLAIFLVAAGEHSYFRAHEGYSADKNDHWMRWFEAYNKPLGAPLGPAKKKGYQYIRHFKHAKVFVDVKERKAQIKWLNNTSK